jgi:hypothetical protein
MVQAEEEEGEVEEVRTLVVLEPLSASTGEKEFALIQYPDCD